MLLACRIALLSVAAAAAAGVKDLEASPVPNLLFFYVDDLSARVGGAYAQPGLTPSTPALERLQRMGVTFTRAYTRVTLCSPSRTATLTGLRPERSRLWTIGPYWRETTDEAAGGRWASLPEALKHAGFNATGAGKVWHPGTSSGGEASWGGGSVGGDDAPFSWSNPVVAGVDPRLRYWECDAWTNSTGQSSASAGLYGGAGCVTSPECVACLESYNATRVRSWVSSPCPDVCYVDPMVSAYTEGALAELAASGERFSFFAGFKRPHLGFQVPDRFLDMYPADVPLATVRTPAENFPLAGWYPNGEIRGFSDIPPFVLDNITFPGMLADAKHAELRRAYYASVSLMDDNLGRVLDAVERLGLRNNTWMLFLSDHGWSLGEHGNWAKVTLQEDVARVPLIVVPPTGAAGEGFLTNVTIGAAEAAFVSALDIFPTIAELFNLTVPDGQLDGRSLVRLLRGEATGGAFDAAFTQIARQDSNCVSPTATFAHEHDSDPPAPSLLAAGAAANCTMGLSVRVRSWRYAVWVDYDYGVPSANSAGPRWSSPGAIRGEELYDHTADDAGDGRAGNNMNGELVNVAGDAAFAAIQAQLLALVMLEFPEGGR